MDVPSGLQGSDTPFIRRVCLSILKNTGIPPFFPCFSSIILKTGNGHIMRKKWRH